MHRGCNWGWIGDWWTGEKSWDLPKNKFCVVKMRFMIFVFISSWEGFCSVLLYDLMNVFQ